LKKVEVNSVEIARLAGVSRSTVSRVINNYTNVPPETREKVMKIIEQYNYYPNMSAQVLAGKKTRTIGLFLVDAGHVSNDILTNMLISSVIENASACGYYVLTHIIRHTGDQEAVKSVKEIFHQRRIDGGIFIGAKNDEPMIEELIAKGFMVAVVDQELPGHCEPNRIVANFDNETGMEQAVDYLTSIGHTSIGVINGNMQRHSGPAKFEGFVKAMDKHGLAINPDWILEGDFHEGAGYAAIHTLLSSGKQLPTAIIAANDSVAFGVMRAFKERGISVPADVSVIGFDDHALSSRHQPALTTVKVDFKYMMKHLTGALIKKIEQGAGGYEPFTVPSTLIIRDSCQSR